MFLKKGILGLLGLLTIGLLSLLSTFVRMPANQTIINGDAIKSSSFSLSFYGSAGDMLFSVSPLNDYYYVNNAKSHLEDKITSSDNGNFIQDIWLSLKTLILNKKELIWNVFGNGASSKSSVNYVVNQISGGVDIQRTINSKINVRSVGQVIKFCADCLVTDNKNRAYFNADTVGQFDIDTATRLHLTPVVVGENQFLPQDITKVKIIDRENNLKMTIPVKQNQVFLQYQWRLLEFKANLVKGEIHTSQEVLLNE